MSRRRAAACLLLWCFTGCSARASELQDGEAALAAGRYDEAISVFTGHVEKGTSDPRAHRGLVRALAEVGRYPEAEERARSFSLSHPESAELRNSLGEILYLRGKLEEAREAFTKSMASGASDRLTAELNLAILRHRQGEVDEAMRGFDRFIDVYNQSARLTTEVLTAVGTACRYLGREDPQLFKDALKAFDEAIAADPKNAEPRVRLGELFLEKYNGADAQGTFQDVLGMNSTHPRALLGMARCLDFNGSPQALELAQKSLEINPNLVAARVFMARVLLGLEEYTEAAKEAEKALAVNPVSLEALSVLAAARYLQGDRSGFEDVRRRALSANPGYADFYNTLAEVCVQNRLYREAVDFAREAVSLDSKSWQGFGLLGLNQLRIGEIDKGKANLETSFAGDPYNVWIKNTLDLLDTFPNFRDTRSARFLVVADRKESDLLGPYVARLAEEAYERLAERYGYRPPTPIRVEVYPSHADFSVRTIGLAGLGALGVCFGTVVAIDSPSARELGQFNWGSTLWHELVHSVTLGMTDHRVPRWFSEGVSVYEERRARPGWGDDVTIAFLTAYRQGKLLPIGDLNNGFVRPRSPEQVPISYYQASLVLELIEREYGFQAVLDMLRGYKEGKATAEVFQSAIRIDLGSFDKKFDAYLKERFGGPLGALRPPPSGTKVEVLSREAAIERAKKDPGDFSAQLATGEALFKEKNLDEAIPYLERAKGLFPEYAAADSPYWYLGLIYKEKGELRRAAEELSKLVAINESHYRAHRELAGLLEKLGETAGAAGALDRAIYIYPYEMDLHQRLADLYTRLGRRQEVIRARQAVVALDPVDRADALYQLALAYFEAGERGSARREVLRALEVAPNFEKAQELLLKLQGGTARPSRS